MVWDARTGRRVRELHAPYGLFPGGGPALFAPDAKHLLVQLRQGERDPRNPIVFALWNVETGAIDGAIGGLVAVDGYAVSVAGQRLAILSGSPGRVFLYDTLT
jgi:hypothetical protein